MTSFKIYNMYLQTAINIEKCTALLNVLLYVHLYSYNNEYFSSVILNLRVMDELQMTYGSLNKQNCVLGHT